MFDNEIDWASARLNRLTAQKAMHNKNPNIETHQDGEKLVLLNREHDDCWLSSTTVFDLEAVR